MCSHKRKSERHMNVPNQKSEMPWVTSQTSSLFLTNRVTIAALPKASHVLGVIIQTV